MVEYRVHKSPPLDLMLSYLNQVYNLTPCSLRSIDI